MITFVRTAAIETGKTTEAYQFAKKISEYILAKHGRQTHVSRPIGGNPNRVAWTSTYASLGELEEASAKILGDAEYVAMVTAAGEYFIAGSLHDEMWRGF